MKNELQLCLDASVAGAILSPISGLSPLADSSNSLTRQQSPVKSSLTPQDERSVLRALAGSPPVRQTSSEEETEERFTAEDPETTAQDVPQTSALSEAGGRVSTKDHVIALPSAASMCAGLAAAEITFANSVLAAAKDALSLLAQERNLHMDETQTRAKLIGKVSQILSRVTDSAERRHDLLLNACSESHYSNPRPAVAGHPATKDFLSVDGIWSDLPENKQDQTTPKVLRSSPIVVLSRTPTLGGIGSSGVQDELVVTPEAGARGTPVAFSHGDDWAADRTPLSGKPGTGGSRSQLTPGTPSYATTGRAAEALQAVWRGRLARQPLGRLVVKLRQRGRTAQEFIQSEMLYLSRLQILVTRYFLPLQAISPAAVSLLCPLTHYSTLHHMRRPVGSMPSVPPRLPSTPHTHTTDTDKDTDTQRHTHTHMRARAHTPPRRHTTPPHPAVRRMAASRRRICESCLATYRSCGT